MRTVHRFRHHPLLGTVLEVRVVASDDVARAVDDVVVREVVRLERIFSAFVEDSELNRWKRGEVADPSAELSHVLGTALDWQRRSGGRFNPLAGTLTAVWRAAEQSGDEPDPSRLDDLAATIRQPRYEMVDGRPVPTGDCSDMNLHAFAKGWIVDAALDAASVAVGVAGAVESVVVNAGGDVAHRGTTPEPVGIEHPFRPYDNEPPLALVDLMNGGLATSGPARQGFLVAGRRRSHVIDPRTGVPVETQASISVLAPDAATADVAATVLGLLPPDGAVAEARSLGVECLVVAPDGGLSTSAGWPGAGR